MANWFSRLLFGKHQSQDRSDRDYQDLLYNADYDEKDEETDSDEFDEF